MVLVEMVHGQREFLLMTGRGEGKLVVTDAMPFIHPLITTMVLLVIRVDHAGKGVEVSDQRKLRRVYQRIVQI